jgi:hypothetical protein
MGWKPSSLVVVVPSQARGPSSLLSSAEGSGAEALPQSGLVPSRTPHPPRGRPEGVVPWVCRRIIPTLKGRALSISVVSAYVAAFRQTAVGLKALRR